MADTFESMQEVIELLRETKDASERAAIKSVIAVTKRAESFAKRNSTRQFTGRNDRYLSGQLLNSIYSGFEREGDDVVGYVGVRNIPYGAIHEFGGTIRPKPTNRMQRLWIPKRINAGRMTPREFMNQKRANPGKFLLTDRVAGRWADESRTRLIPLFFLVPEVKIPERPYLRPAVEEALDYFPGYYETFLKEEIGGG